MFKKISLGIIALMLVAALSACAAGAPLAPGTPASTNTSSSNNSSNSSNQPATRTMSVTGAGQVMLAPDLAYINIGVHSEGSDVLEALTSNTSQAQKVSDTLTGMGIDVKDIQTSNFNIYPQQMVGPNGEQTGIKYMVDNTVYVTLRDLTKMGTLLNAVAQAGANNINGITFDSSKKNEAVSQARQAAIQDAKTQAAELASAAGVTLGAVQSLNVVSNNTPYTMYDAKGGAPALASGSVPVSAGQLVITASANVVYEIK